MLPWSPEDVLRHCLRTRVLPLPPGDLRRLCLTCKRMQGFAPPRPDLHALLPSLARKCGYSVDDYVREHCTWEETAQYLQRGPDERVRKRSRRCPRLAVALWLKGVT
jgi:hypothetical protein